MTWRIILQLALSGLSIGSIYALVGLALVLPFKASGIVNFAQGEIVTFGAYLALILSGLGLPYMAVVPLVLVGAAMFLEHVCRVRNRDDDDDWRETDPRDAGR